jgi:hypothetical protein
VLRKQVLRLASRSNRAVESDAFLPALVGYACTPIGVQDTLWGRAGGRAPHRER